MPFHRHNDLVELGVKYSFRGDRECLLVVADNGQASEGDAEAGSFKPVVPVVVEICLVDDVADGSQDRGFGEVVAAQDQRTCGSSTTRTTRCRSGGSARTVSPRGSAPLSCAGRAATARCWPDHGQLP